MTTYEEYTQFETRPVSERRRHSKVKVTVKL